MFVYLFFSFCYRREKYSCLNWEITHLKSFWVLSCCSKKPQISNQSFVSSWKSQLISVVTPICIYGDFNHILNWAEYYRKASRGLNYFWTVTWNLLGQSLFWSCRCNFFSGLSSWAISCNTDHHLCLVFRSVCVCSVCVLHRNHQCPPFYTRHSLSVTSEQEEIHRWVKCHSWWLERPCQKGGHGEGRRECRGSRKNKYFFALIVILNKIGRKKKFCQPNLNKGIFLPFNRYFTSNLHQTFKNLSPLHKYKLKVVGTSFRGDQVLYH